MNKHDKINLLKMVLVVLVWGAILLGGYMSWYVPRLSALQEETAKQEAVVQEMAAFNKAHPDKVGYVHILKAKERLAKEKLPSNLEVASVLGDLNTKALASKVHITAIQPRPIHEDKQWRILPIQLTVQGDFWGILAFLRKIESTGRLITVNSGKIGQENGIIICDLSLNIYGDKAKKQE